MFSGVRKIEARRQAYPGRKKSHRHDPGRSANFGVETLMKITEILQVSADSLLRTDIPEVSVIYAGDLDALLKDCTAEEVESMMNMLRQMKTALIKARPTEN